MSPHVLPPLKFHSGLLVPHTSLVSRSIIVDDDHDDNDDADDHDHDESVASAPDDLDGNYSDESTSISNDFVSLGNPVVAHDDVQVEDTHINLQNITNLNRHGSSSSSSVYRGLSKENLSIQLPHNFRRFTTDSYLGVRGCDQSNLNPSNKLQPRVRVAVTLTC